MFIAGDKVKHKWDGATGTIEEMRGDYAVIIWDFDLGHKFSVLPEMLLPVNETVEILAPAPAIGDTRACPDCGRPQHYTGTKNGWAHDATIATLTCGASPALLAELEK